jgi:hypothetical protein
MRRGLDRSLAAVFGGLQPYARDSRTRSFAASLHASQTVLPFALGLAQQT